MTVAKTTDQALESFLNRARAEDARRRLLEAGLPSRRLEQWRYTPLNAFKSQPYGEVKATGKRYVTEDVLRQLPERPGHALTFLNGELVEGDDYAFLKVADDAETVVRVSADAANSPMGVLNAALRRPGARIEIPSGHDAGIVSLTAMHEVTGASSTHLHHIISVKPGAALTLLDFQTGNGSYFANPYYTIDVGAGAKLAHIRVIGDSTEAVNMGVVDVHVAAEGCYNSFTLVTGGRLSRQEVYAHLTEERGQVHVNGAQLLGSDQLGDLTSVITHSAADCQSRQVVANVIHGEGKGVFQGKVIVAPHAQKTDGFQMNQALLLSPHAEINSKPELEIYADDVKCSHGATVGALDDEQLFYLRTRGIGETQARDLLIEAFLTEVMALAPSEEVLPFLKQRLEMASRLRLAS